MSKRSQRRVVPDPAVRHGTLYQYRRGCSCDECKGAARSKNQRARQRNDQGEPPFHGAEYIYNAYGCRCEPCRTAAADARAARKARTYSTRVPPGEHGKVETYNRWGCRCPKCKEAAANWRRLKRIDAGLPVRPVNMTIHNKIPRAQPGRPLGKAKLVGRCEVCGKPGFDFLGGRRCYVHRPGGLMGTLV